MSGKMEETHEKDCMTKVGLTGGIGTGKSTVLSLLRELKVPVISADEIVHELYKTDTVLKERVRQTFGEECLTPQGEIDRKRLAAIIFPAPEKRKLLEFW